MSTLRIDSATSASSSTKRIRPRSLIGTSRQNNAKGRTLTEPRFVTERATMPLDNTSRNRKAQAGAAVFGRMERIEQSFFHVRRDSFAGVGYLEDGDFTRAPVEQH